MGPVLSSEDKDFLINYLIYRLTHVVENLKFIEEGTILSFPNDIEWYYMMPSDVVDDSNQLNLFEEE
tara:strand:+ start:3887 stop:4087 length:201 start_codon:yes stop_codon:yes gene_type:complete